MEILSQDIVWWIYWEKLCEFIDWYTRWISRRQFHSSKTSTFCSYLSNRPFVSQTEIFPQIGFFSQIGLHPFSSSIYSWFKGNICTPKKANVTHLTKLAEMGKRRESNCHTVPPKPRRRASGIMKWTRLSLCFFQVTYVLLSICFCVKLQSNIHPFLKSVKGLRSSAYVQNSRPSSSCIRGLFKSTFL